MTSTDREKSEKKKIRSDGTKRNGGENQTRKKGRGSVNRGGLEDDVCHGQRGG